MPIISFMSVKKLGQSIKRRRVLLGITQEALAQISGTSLRSLKALEIGKANPTWKRLVKIGEVLGWEIELRERKI